MAHVITAEEHEARMAAARSVPKEHWITHEELSELIKELHPGATAGADFLVGHPVDEQGQAGDAFIARWNLDAEPPTVSVIAELKRLRRSNAVARLAASEARYERRKRLEAADVLAAKALDAGDLDKLKVIGEYRAALRSLPEQEGFPHAIVWPSAPE